MIYFSRVVKIEPHGPGSSLLTGCPHRHETANEAWACPSAIEFVVEHHVGDDGSSVEIPHLKKPDR